MAHCAREACGAWRPAILVRIGGLGFRLDDAWYCSAHCLELAARDRLARTAPAALSARQAFGPTRLGGVLAAQKQLPREVVERAAAEQARTGLRIGTQLVALGVASKFDVLRALAAQGGVGFLTSVDTSRVSSAPGRLSPHVVRALGLVPFEVDHKHDVLKVACTAPVPRASVAALRELTGSVIEPYLVADEQWPALVEAYCASSRARGNACSPIADVAAAAARVAAAARQARGVRMSEVRCDDDVWVRLDAGGEIEELWLSDGPRDATGSVNADRRAVPFMKPWKARQMPAFEPAAE